MGIFKKFKKYITKKQIPLFFDWNNRFFLQRKNIFDYFCTYSARV